MDKVPEDSERRETGRHREKKEREQWFWSNPLMERQRWVSLCLGGGGWGVEWGRLRGKGAGQHAFTVLPADWLGQHQAGRAVFNQRCASPAAVSSQQTARYCWRGRGADPPPSLCPYFSPHVCLAKISLVKGC